jgi:alpha-amylase
MSLLRSSLAVTLLLTLACASSPQAFANKQRAVGRTVPGPSGPVQWQHEWAKEAVFYEIFVRSFRDSNGDGIGDLNGLIEKLDYLNDGNPATTSDLGIRGIWLMPVFESPSYHGYDTIDYETIERDYGTNTDFDRLLAEAHRRGIRVIVDLVVNHTSNQHPWFLESASSPSSAKRNWYVWNDTNPNWSQPWGGNPTWHASNGSYYYGVFWGGMPDINWQNAGAKAEMLRIARFWLAKGVDGFRLDATRYLVETGPGPGQADTPQTHAALKDLATAVRTAKPESVLVAENWTTAQIIAQYYGDTSTIAGGDEMPMNFNFPLADAIVNGANSASPTPVIDAIRTVQTLYPAGANDAPFLTNHDQRRVASVLGNDTGKNRVAAAILLTLPGTPFLYYGEEVGLQNGPTSGDESKRTPMPWTPGGGFTSGTPWFGHAPGLATANVETQTSNPASLLSRYRTLIHARNASAALQKGSIELLPSSQSTIAFLRRTPAETVLVVHNLGDAFSKTANLPFSASGFETIFADGNVMPAGASNAWTVTLPARGVGIWKVK